MISNEKSTNTAIVQNRKKLLSNNKVVDSISFEIIEFTPNFPPTIIKKYILPNPNEIIYDIMPIKNNYLVLTENGFYLIDYYIGKITQLSTNLSQYSDYVWHFNNRVFFRNKISNAITETSNGITFKETIPGLKISKMNKPSIDGYSLSYATDGLFYLINLNNNTYKTIDNIGLLKTFSFSIEAAMMYRDKLVVFTSDGIYVRKY